MVLIGALSSAPVFAADDQRRQHNQNRQGDTQQQQQHEHNNARHAVPRQAAPRQNVAPQQDVQRQDVQRYDNNRRYDAQRYTSAPRQYSNGSARSYAVPRVYPRQYYSYANGRYVPRTVIVPRYIRPSIVTVVPYRPYVYRPSIGIGAYYGVGGAYPYGYTPRGYYDPLPGRAYGGLRITGAPRDAQVFADGYYVGIVNDFDGVFQHMNLEAGPHHILVQEPGLQPIEFDVMVQPGQTITFRADVY